MQSLQHAWLVSRHSDCSARGCADDAGQWLPREFATNIQKGLRAPDPRCSIASAVCHPSALMHHQRACKAFESCEMLYHRACGCSAAACSRLGPAPAVHRLPAPRWLGWCMHRCSSLKSLQHAWLVSRQSGCSDRGCADDAGQWLPR